MSEPAGSREEHPPVARSYRGLYLLVILALAADIVFLAWLTERWR